MSNIDMQKKEVQLVFLGDMSVGKTAAIYTFCHEKFPKQYIPTIFDTYVKNITL